MCALGRGVQPARRPALKHQLSGFTAKQAKLLAYVLFFLVTSPAKAHDPYSQFISWETKAHLAWELG